MAYIFTSALVFVTELFFLETKSSVNTLLDSINFRQIEF